MIIVMRKVPQQKIIGDGKTRLITEFFRMNKFGLSLFRPGICRHMTVLVSDLFDTERST